MPGEDEDDQVIDLDAATVNRLPVGELAMGVLQGLVASREWNEYNYLNSAGKIQGSVVTWLPSGPSRKRSDGSVRAG